MEHDGMTTNPIGNLTERQKECLRLVAASFQEKEIARELGIHHETVRKHIKGAMAKLGTNSRFVAARALAEHERHNPSGVPPRGAVSQTAQNDEDEPSTTPAGVGDQDGQVCETRTEFEQQSLRWPPVTEPASETGALRNELTPMIKLLVAATLTILLAVVVVSAVPMSNAFQQFADAMVPR